MAIPGVLAKTNHLHHQSGTVHQEFAVPVKAGETIRRGDFLKMVSVANVGAVEQALALSGNDNDTTTGANSVLIYGVATSDSYTDIAGNLVCNVAPISKGLQVLLPILGANAGVSRQLDVDKLKLYLLARRRGGSASEWFYAMSATSDADGQLRPLQFYKGDVPTTQYGRVYVQIRDAKAQS